MDNILYDREFCSTRWKHRTWQIAVGKLFCNTFKIKSVTDFGCSIGSFLEGFQKGGAKIKGYEICYEHLADFTNELILPFIEFGDVTEIIETPKVDCAFSVEVAEHIPKEYSDIFIDNLVRASKKYIILSAAPIGQGGIGHINCQASCFWIKKLESKGFKYHHRKTQMVLQRMYEIKDIPKWMKNLMVFKKV